MRFGLIHRIMTDSLATLGILALVTSGKLNPVATALILVGLVIGIFLPIRYRQQAFLKLTGVVGPLAALAVQGARLSLGGSPIPIIVEFAAMLQVLRLATRRGAAHDHQVILLALLHLIAGTVLGGGLTYAVALAGFLVFTPGALVLSHLRREVEGNYRQGARDRTGMPVDVPRILRSRRVIGRGFLLFTCSLSIPVFLFSAVLFLIFPRVGFAWLNVPTIEPSRVVGFSNKVDLGGVGTIRTDTTLVMRVVPSDMRDGVAEGDMPAKRKNLYLRGAVFDSYNGRSWARHRTSHHPVAELHDRVILRRSPKKTDRTLRIDLERIEPPVVFMPGEAVALDVLTNPRQPLKDRHVVSMDLSGQLQYAGSDKKGLKYKVYLPPQGLIVPDLEEEEDLRRYLRLPPNLSERVKDLALDMTEGETEALDIARALEKGLRKGYSYNLGSPSGKAKDPLDHFLFESKKGHCEFYSTAMAIMLRVRGVPSRNVTGFVGGTYNRFGQFYAVRQGDAHSWVEAYLPERGWFRFDPTPPSSAGPQASTEGVQARLRDWFEAASQNWRGVENYDLEQQIGILRSIRGLMRDSGLSAGGESSSPRFNFRRVGLGLSGMLLIGVGVVLWVRRRRDVETSPRPIVSMEASQAIELYRRLEAALEARGVARPISTPPLTHARALRAAGHPVGEEALALTEIYMAVRYGKKKLSDDDIAEFASRVAALKRPPEKKAA